MNLGEIKTAVQRFGFDGSDPLLTWINAALHDFEDSFAWPFLLKITSSLTTTPQADSLGGLPTDFFKPVTLKIRGQSDPLIPIDWIRLEEEFDTGTDPSTNQPMVAYSTPRYYAQASLSTISLFPVPDKAYLIRMMYQMALPELVNDVDVPAIPAKYHYGIVEKAAVIGLLAENEEDRAATHQGVYDEMIARAINAYSTKQGGSFNQVRDTQGYGSCYYG